MTPKQLAAAESFVQVGAWISHLVLMEAVWGPGRGCIASSPEQIRGRGIEIEMLLDHQQLVVQDRPKP